MTESPRSDEPQSPEEPQASTSPALDHPQAGVDTQTDVVDHGDQGHQDDESDQGARTDGASPAGDAEEADGPASEPSDPAARVRELEEEGDIAADYLEELLDIADLDGDIDIDVDGDRASVEIRGADRLARLNRPKGELLDALQELARLAVQSRTGNRSRLMLDIGGFRAQRKEDLEQLAEDAVGEARENGRPVPLRPMNPFERKVVHDVAKHAGLRSESDGDGKDRHVVIYPAS